jgi:uncharacterized protein YutE (UPF0331/DUF86 family)
MLDRAFLMRKIKLIQEDLSHLKDYSKYSFDEIEKDYAKAAVVERLLEKIIVRAIDVNQHILSEKGNGSEKVRGYEDTFIVLSELDVYPTEFAKKIAPSAGLRNRLVHEYDDIDSEIIYKSVGDALEQYTKYCDYILDFVNKNTEL